MKLQNGFDLIKDAWFWIRYPRLDPVSAVVHEVLVWRNPSLYPPRKIQSPLWKLANSDVADCHLKVCISTFFSPIIQNLFFRFQIWRPFTALFYYPLSPLTGFHFLINLYYLYNYRLYLCKKNIQWAFVTYLQKYRFERWRWGKHEIPYMAARRLSANHEL